MDLTKLALLKIIRGYSTGITVFQLHKILTESSLLS